MLRLDGYVRVSRVGGREGEGYISPDVQREAIERYAGEMGGEVVAWQTDEDYSGGNTERPGFQAALERLEAGETDGVVVMRIDRFARSTADGSRIVREIVGRGQIFASCHERIDPKTPEGGFMLRSFLSNAELFLDQIKASWETSKARAIARGAHIGPTPIGYQRVPKGGMRSGCLVPDPDYGPAITELFERAAERREGDSALARWMTQRARRQAGAAWNSNEIRRWLANRVYLGEVRYGSLVNAEAHEPLTDPETWEKCQRELGDRRVAPSPFLLNGLIRCAGCRYMMGGLTTGGASRKTPVYRCGRGSQGCPEPTVIVASRIEGYLTELADTHLKGLAVERRPAQEAIDAFRRAADEVEAFVGDISARALMGEEAWQEGLRVRAAERERLKPAHDAAVAEREALQLARIGVASLEEPELRRALVGLMRHVFIRRGRGVPASERALVIWSADTRRIDVPGPHRPGPFEPVRW